MPRTIQLSLSPVKADIVLQELEEIEGVISLSFQKSASIRPPGDILTLQVTNDAMREVLQALDDLQVIEGSSILTSGH